MINIIRSIFNAKNKLYIVVNNKKVDKGKIARACETVGQRNPHMLFSKVIVVKGGDTYKQDKERYTRLGLKISGEHVDLGKTQCKRGTSLAYGVITNNNDNLELSLF